MATNKNFIVKNGLEVGQDIIVTGNITQAGMTLPASDGSAGQFLQTDGAGNLSFATVQSSIGITDGSTTDTVNTGETITFNGVNGLTPTVSDNTVSFEFTGSTTNVSEGTNLYYTDARAIAAIEGSENLTIDGGTLYIDTSNNYVGIGDTSPQYMLDVGGTTGTGSIAVAGTEVIDSSAEIITSQLKDSGVSAGEYGSASLVPVITVDAKGRVTAASTTSVAGVSSFSFNDTSEVLTINTADGGTYTADISALASETYVDTALSNLLDGAPAALDTLNEIAAAINDDADFAGTITSALSGKVSKNGDSISGALSVSGDLTIDTDTLYVDAANNRVGIGTTSPETKLHLVSGNNALKWSQGPNSISQIEMHDSIENPVFIQAWSSSLRVAVAAYDNPAIVVNSDRQTYFYGQSIKLPAGTTAQRPATQPGKLRFNETFDQPEYVNNANEWVPLNIPGYTAGNAAPSAKYLYDNGFVTSGKGMYWIDTPNGGVKQVFCDFDTPDENGESGWMLVGTFATDYDWTNGGTTTNNTITDSFSGNQISSNFGDHNVTMFRVTANGTINTSLGSSAVADWYYYLSSGDAWKRWWAPDTGFSYWNGQSYPIYASDGTIRGRQALQKFTHARNIKYAYTQTNQIAVSLSDASVNTSGYYAGGSTTQYWQALTAPGYFSVRNQMVSSSSVCADGTLGILPQGATGNPNAVGQDIMNGNCKVGYDDNQAAAWYGQSATESFGATQNPGTRNTTSLFWWIK